VQASAARQSCRCIPPCVRQDRQQLPCRLPSKQASNTTQLSSGRCITITGSSCALEPLCSTLLCVASAAWPARRPLPPSSHIPAAARRYVSSCQSCWSRQSYRCLSRRPRPRLGRQLARMWQRAGCGPMRPQGWLRRPLGFCNRGRAAYPRSAWQRMRHRCCPTSRCLRNRDPVFQPACSHPGKKGGGCHVLLADALLL
jgi:hypothetical protein